MKGLVLVQIVEVEIKQSCRFVGILIVEGDEAIAEVERNGCGVGIDGNETAPGLVVGSKVALDEAQ